MHDVSDYLHLVDTLHYDNEYDSVYKSTRVVEGEDYIVVYRKKQLKNGQWTKGDLRLTKKVYNCKQKVTFVSQKRNCKLLFTKCNHIMLQIRSCDTNVTYFLLLVIILR